MEPLHKSLKKRMIDLEMRQADLAEAAGLSRDQVQRILSGKTGASFGAVMRLLDALDLDLEARPRTQH